MTTKELAKAVRARRGRRSRKDVAMEMGVSEVTLATIERLTAKISDFTETQARNWVNG